MNSNPVSRYHSAKINLQSHSQFKPCLWLPSALGMESLFYPVIKYLSESILSFFPKFPLSFPIYIKFLTISQEISVIYKILFSQNAVPIFLI